MGRPDRLRFDARQPHQRRAERDRRQRQGTAAHPHHSTQGGSLRRHRQRSTRRPGRAIARRRAAAAGINAARPAGDCRAAVRQHERRPGTGVFLRRNQRGHHHRAVEIALVLRDRPQLVLHLQGQGGAPEAGRRGARGTLRARRQREKERRPRAHHRAAQRHRHRQPPLGRAFRPRPDRRIRRTGRDHRRHCRGDRTADLRCGKFPKPAQTAQQHGCVGSRDARAVASLAGHAA